VLKDDRPVPVGVLTLIAQKEEPVLLDSDEENGFKMFEKLLSQSKSRILYPKRNLS